MPDGQSLKVELVHALHPDAPFICLIDYSETSDMAFVQTLLDGNGQEIHKIGKLKLSKNFINSNFQTHSPTLTMALRPISLFKAPKLTMLSALKSKPSQTWTKFTRQHVQSMNTLPRCVQHSIFIFVSS